jgi:electron transfer flavoprotein alpha subunit
MAGAIWVLGESKGPDLARVSAEVATLGRALGKAASRDVVGVVAGASPDALAAEFAKYAPLVHALAVPQAAETAFASAVAPSLAALIEREQPAYLLVGATSDGKDIAGILSVLLGWGVIANASAVSWQDGRPEVEVSILGGKLVTTSAFTGEHGIITVRPTSVTAEPLAAPGSVDPVTVTVTPEIALPAVAVTSRVTEETAAVPIEEARVIVCAGRGVGSPQGMELVQSLANALGGSVGASRAAVDSGLVPYSQQIGQTGKTVKPRLYVGLGVSGAMQHMVGMQTSETIVAVNRDAEAPITQAADLVVIGDLFAFVPALISALQARSS